jgi:gluconate kinase
MQNHDVPRAFAAEAQAVSLGIVGAARGIVHPMKPKRRGIARRAAGSPFLHRVSSLPEHIDQTKYPFNIRAFLHGIDLAFRSRVTFFVGENGSGKSTLLEAIAECCGFNPEGGNRDHHRAVFADRSPLAQALRLSWLPKVTEGFFMRAESFYNFATYIEGVSDLRAYGGKSLHEQSHGESFISLFANRSSRGSTFWMSLKRRFRRNDSSHSSRSSTTSRRQDMRNS